MNGIVLIMRGPPGSGKSSFINAIMSVPGDPLGSMAEGNLGYDRHDMVVISIDKYLTVNGKYHYSKDRVTAAYKQCMADFDRVIQRRPPMIIVDNTNTYKDHYKFYVSTAKQYGYAVFTVTAEGWDVEECVKRNVHNVPADVVRRMARDFER